MLGWCLKVPQECVGQSDQYQHVQGRRWNEEYTARRKFAHGLDGNTHLAKNHKCSM